jgi:hypothetical protein
MMRTIGLLALLLVSGCDKLSPYREAGNARLAGFEAICQKLAALPPLAADAVKPVDLKYGLGSEKRNVVWIHEEELPCTAPKAGPIPLRMIAPLDFNWSPAVSLLRNGPLGNETKSEIQGAFDRFFALEHVVVVKISSVVEPKLEGAETFVPGAVTGEAHLFTIAGGVHQGGVKFAATSSPKVSVEVMRSAEGLRKDLGAAAYSAASRALAKQLPERR